MKITELHLQNFRGFEDLTIKFPKDNVAVFIGENGAGKSAILDAIGVLFSQIIAKSIRQAFASTKKPDIILGYEDIRLGADKCNLQITTIHDSYIKSNYFLNFPTNGKKQEEDDSLIKYLSQKLQVPEEAVPVFAFYQSERIVSKLWDSRGYLSQTQLSQSAVYRNIFRTNFFYFDDFFKWFESEESYEDKIRLEGNFDYRNPKLEVVRQALELFLDKLSNTSFSNLKVRKDRKGYLDTISSSLTISKNGKDLNISQLSTGEKTLLLMVVDIAMRMSIANSGNKSLYGKGIVLIDEIDLHLHPQWQQEVLTALMATFPNIQFIVTTHSPQVLSKINRENVFILEDGKLMTDNPHTYGRDVASILYEVFGVEARPKEIQKRLNECFRLLENEEFDKATQIMKELTIILGENDTDLMRAKLELELNV